VAKYLLIASYTSEGAKGVLKDGGSVRRDAATKAVAGVGGKVESFYFGFGSEDADVVVDYPDNASAAAASLTIGSSGAVSVRTVVLMTPEEMDDAAKKSKSIDYSPPGK
jgi:uncharacterized protein with GYD domain